jgi:lipopolysaccharide transport system permease protein
MNPHATLSTSPRFMLQTIWRNRYLIYQMSKREIIGRYKGSTVGLLWSFLTPMMMLAVYTFVFSVVFKARWIGGSDSKTEFALVLFAGLIIFNLFAESASRAPSLIVSNVNYVKKVIFPLEILPVITLISALFNLLISLIVWLLFYLIFFGIPSAQLLLLPIVILPFILLTLGICWFLASLGVFFRDIAQFIGIAINILMYLSPIFFPVTALPVELRQFMLLSPLTSVIEQARNVMIWHRGLDWLAWGEYMGLSLVIAMLGFAWFQKTRKGFADVL